MTYSILPDGKQFQVAETNGVDGTLTVYHFETKANACQWVALTQAAKPETTRWRDRLPPERKLSATDSDRCTYEIHHVRRHWELTETPREGPAIVIWFRTRQHARTYLFRRIATLNADELVEWLATDSEWIDY
jgi:hypothetical protein